MNQNPLEKKIPQEEPNKIGKNFDEEPMSFEDFVVLDDRGHYIYNNFFYNFYNYEKGVARNYERLKTVNEKLADELSIVYNNYRPSFLGGKGEKIPEEETIKGHSYPRSLLQKGYEAYLLLRENFKNDKELLERIKNYYEGNKKNSDDWAAFFS